MIPGFDDGTIGDSNNSLFMATKDRDDMGDDGSRNNRKIEGNRIIADQWDRR